VLDEDAVDYDINKDGASLGSRELLGTTSGKWEARPAWPDACWDGVTSYDGAR